MMPLITIQSDSGFVTISAATARTPIDPKERNESATNTSSQKRKSAQQGKPTTKLLEELDDPDYVSSDEDEDGRSGGAQTLPLLLKISKPCRPCNPTYQQNNHCIDRHAQTCIVSTARYLVI